VIAIVDSDEGGRLYDPVMMRWLAVLPAVASMAIAGVAVASVAGAEPSSEPTICSYTLSPPQLVQVSSVTMVTATVTAGGCQGPANPAGMIACVTAAGDQTAGQCKNEWGNTTVQVYYPYRPGVTYTSKGSGCAAVARPPSSICTSLGPYTASL
jgi:hypothetical protein